MRGENAAPQHAAGRRGRRGSRGRPRGGSDPPRVDPPPRPPSPQVLVFDNRGIGRSSVPADPAAYSIASMADDASAVLTAAGWWGVGERGETGAPSLPNGLPAPPVHLVGFSMGSCVAVRLAARTLGGLGGTSAAPRGPPIASVHLVSPVGRGGLASMPTLRGLMLMIRASRARTDRERIACDHALHFTRAFLDETDTDAGSNDDSDDDASRDDGDGSSAASVAAAPPPPPLRRGRRRPGGCCGGGRPKRAGAGDGEGDDRGGSPRKRRREPRARADALADEYLCAFRRDGRMSPAGEKGQIHAVTRTWRLMPSDVMALTDSNAPPVVVMSGASDLVTPSARAADLACRLRATCLLVDAAHFVPIQAAGALNATLLSAARSCAAIGRPPAATGAAAEADSRPAAEPGLAPGGAEWRRRQRRARGGRARAGAGAGGCGGVGADDVGVDVGASEGRPASAVPTIAVDD